MADAASNPDQVVSDSGTPPPAKDLSPVEDLAPAEAPAGGDAKLGYQPGRSRKFRFINHSDSQKDR